MTRIGLLFVHGIGEQKRFEHLRNSVREFAELLKMEERCKAQAKARDRKKSEETDEAPETPRTISVVDRTADWEPPDVDLCPAKQKPPITLSITHAGEEDSDTDIEVDCHEVWWSDLGARDSLGEKIGFWIWGLGQWAAPIYSEIDPTGIDTDQLGQSRGDKNHSEAAKTEDTQDEAVRTATAQMPESVAGRFFAEWSVRVRLAAAGLVTILTVFSWALLKRLFEFFADAPSTTLIFQYVGDVRTYERRATPNRSRASDPGLPLRVPIRRRMVSEMVAMAERDYDGWYICAHSLGSVVAYNGLTEIGHALPNYLSEEQWMRLPQKFKHRKDTAKRPVSDIHMMMPARPAWLSDTDVIDRRRLFKHLRGFLTYGSPLDKFAAIWPRIVATADDRPADKPAFGERFRWINVASANDPVAGVLDEYDSKNLKGVPKPLTNVRTVMDWMPGLSHIRYFRSSERSTRNRRTEQRYDLVNWLFRPISREADKEKEEADGKDKKDDLAHTAKYWWQRLVHSEKWYIRGALPTEKEAEDDEDKARMSRWLNAGRSILAWVQYIAIMIALLILTGIVFFLAGGILAAFGLDGDTVNEAIDKAKDAIATGSSNPDEASGPEGAQTADPADGQKSGSTLALVKTAIGGMAALLGIEALSTDAIARITALFRSIFGAAAAAMAILSLTGIWRWFSEASLNLKLANADGKDPAILRLLGAQRVVSTLWLVLAIVSCALAIAADLGIYHAELLGFALMTFEPPLNTLATATMALVSAMIAQALVNWSFVDKKNAAKN
ncbi:hypothetical protein [Parasphingopyxis sp.]|uniref:hypothetical protein n=1 Tax=Parasphingopyxis sp. TaxID=1920299 RepID=UPI002613ACB4|nr:hypothetical protein [Parasphingopyxis sp.]